MLCIPTFSVQRIQEDYSEQKKRLPGALRKDILGCESNWINLVFPCQNVNRIPKCLLFNLFLILFQGCLWIRSTDSIVAVLEKGV